MSRLIYYGLWPFLCSCVVATGDNKTGWDKNDLEIDPFVNLTIGMDDRNRFEHRLLEMYDNRFAPPARPLKVKANPELASITDLDQQAETVSYYIYMRFNWTDERLAWSRDEYDHEKIWLPVESVWRPDIVIYKMVHMYYPARYQPPMKVLVFPSGEVSWIFPVVATVTCPFDFHKLPYDVQKCDLTFTSWQNSAKYVTLEPVTPDGIITTHYNADNQWDLVNNTVEVRETKYECCPNPYSTLTYKLAFKRKPQYYFVYLVTPSFLLSFVSLVGIFTPSSSGIEREEKVTLGITAILTISVFLTIVADQTPKIAEYVPILGRFFMYLITLLSTATIWSVVMIGLERNAVKGKPFPRWLKPMMSCSRKKNVKPPLKPDIADDDVNALETPESQRIKLIKDIYETVRDIRTCISDDDRILKSEWHVLAFRLDMVGLLIHGVVLVYLTFVWYYVEQI